MTCVSKWMNFVDRKLARSVSVTVSARPRRLVGFRLFQYRNTRTLLRVDVSFGQSIENIKRCASFGCAGWLNWKKRRTRFSCVHRGNSFRWCVRAFWSLLLVVTTLMNFTIRFCSFFFIIGWAARLLLRRGNCLDLIYVVVFMIEIRRNVSW